MTFSFDNRAIYAECANPTDIGAEHTLLTPVAAQNEAASAESCSSVDFELCSKGNKDYAIIRGLDSNGEKLWEVVSPEYDMLQIEAVQDIGLTENCYLYLDYGSVVALSRTNGTELWRNSEFGGWFGGAALFADDAIYLGGGWGPVFFAVDYSGNTLGKIQRFSEDFFGTCDMEFAENGIRVYCEQLGMEATYIVNLSDYSYVLEAAWGERES